MTQGQNGDQNTGVTMSIREVLWQSPEGSGAERCLLQATASGFSLSGTALLVHDGRPCEARYSVRLDDAWRTRAVRVDWSESTEAASIVVDVEPGSLSSDGGAEQVSRWYSNGVHVADLDGCVDVDLEFTPATNTLPVQRLALAQGSAAEVDVAWLRVPALTLERSAQRYERLDATTYRYSSGRFATTVEFDEVGLVHRYGEYWRRQAAHTSIPRLGKTVGGDL